MHNSFVWWKASAPRTFSYMDFKSANNAADPLTHLYLCRREYLIQLFKMRFSHIIRKYKSGKLNSLNLDTKMGQIVRWSIIFFP